MSNNKSRLSLTKTSGRKVFNISPSLQIKGSRRIPRRLFTLGNRLMVTIIFLVVIPISLMAYIYNSNMEKMLIDNANQVMASSASKLVDDIDSFLVSRLLNIEKNSQSEEVRNYLKLSDEARSGSQAEENARSLLRSLHSDEYATHPHFLGYILFNPAGVILIDTGGVSSPKSPAFMGIDQADPALFQSLVQEGHSYISSALFISEADKPFIFFTTSLREDGQSLGFLSAAYDAYVLQTIVIKYNSLAGTASFALIIDDLNLRLAQGIYPESLYKTIIPPGQSQLSQNQSTFRLPVGEDLSSYLPDLHNSIVSYRSDQPYISGRFIENSRDQYIGAIERLKTKPWSVLIIQPQATYLTPLRQLLFNTTWIGLIITAVVLFIAWLVSLLLTNPIRHLTQVAIKLSQGDYNVQALPEPGEFGLLAEGFNAMTTELKNTLAGLEQRIAERTSELAHASEQMRRRANRLQAVTEVAHTITTMQDMDRLLPQVTQLISERFGYYHVGIFLIDQTGQFAILKATNSEGGMRMLSRGHQLRVGQEGIVGYVTDTSESRVALDVGIDNVYFNNPDLPMTRSEAALPLLTAGKIIGALDVQSTEPDAFDNEDIAILGTLANQVAIAIQNNQLFSETNQALQELRSLHSQYLQQAWTQVSSERSMLGYQYQYGKILPVPAEDTGAAWKQVRTGKPVILPASVEPGDEITSGPTTPVLLAPISVRNQVIGVLHLPAPDNSYHWDEEDINMVQEVTDQIGLALENARLLEQSQLRAEREHTVADITTKLRASNDIQEIIATATQELSRALRVKQARLVIRKPADSSQAEPGTLPDLNPGSSEGNHNPYPES